MIDTTKAQAWDGWPDGEWSYQFTHSEYEALNKLSVHWATAVLGGDRHYNINSPTLEGGKHIKRKCLGIIHCQNPNCDMIIRPQTRDTGIRKQLNHNCDCGWNLHHVTCNVMSTLIHYKNGIMYHNGGIHLHQRPTHRLHLLPNEQSQLYKIFQEHPKMGSLQLAVGIPGLTGPGKSVTEISPVLLNVDRVRYEKKKSKIIGGTTESALEQIADFESRHADFLRYSEVGATTILVLQTSWMELQIMLDVVQYDAVHGFVSDAAHGYWRMSDWVLIVSSVYSRHLYCWVPVLFSAANGTTSNHY